MKKKTRYILFSFAALATILLASCAAAAPSFTEERGAFVGEVSAPMAEAPAADFAAGMDSGGGVVSNDALAAQAPERLVIKNASLSIVVDDPEQRMKEIGALAERLGGFVVNSTLYKTSLSNGLEVPAAYITIRVPAEDFLSALDQIREGAIDVPNDNQSGEDVTAAYTDLQSRLRNLEAAEVMLRQIMDEARDTEDVLNAFNQLNYITEQIEVLKGQINYYEESAALSAISVEIVANESVQPIKVGPWDITGVAKEAIESLVRALQGIAEAMVWIALYLVPITLIIGIPAWLIFRGLRGWYARRRPSRRSK